MANENLSNRVSQSHSEAGDTKQLNSLTKEKPVRFISRVRRFLKPLAQGSTTFGIIATSFAISVIIVHLTPPNEENAVATISVDGLQSLFVGTEMMQEVGPNFSEEREMYCRILEGMIRRAGGGAYSSFSNSLEAQLSPVVAILKSSDTSNRSSSNAIRQAAGVLIAKSEYFARSKAGAVSPNLVSLSDSADTMAKVFRDFDQCVEEFQKHPVRENAEFACMQSRYATEMLLNDWPRFAKQIQIDRFINRLAFLEGQILEVAGTLPQNEKSQLERYAKNVNRRRCFVLAMNNNDFEKARNVLLVSRK